MFYSFSYFYEETKSVSVDFEVASTSEICIACCLFIVWLFVFLPECVVQNCLFYSYKT